MITTQIHDLIARGALFACNHSGGKDSQAMYLVLRELVPADQLVIVHADLGEVEWAGALAHIEATTRGERIEVCRSRRTLLQMIEERGMFPSPQQRQCTSDLKRGPIERTIRGLVEERIRGWLKEELGWTSTNSNRNTEGREMALRAGMGLVVNCMGMRAQESPGRSKLKPFKLNDGNSKAGREWYDWLPIHDWTTAQVFERIADAGQRPHAVYAQGMSRFSCCFCIMASEHDLRTAAQLNPDLYRRYVELERSTGQTMLMPKNGVRRTLEDVTGVRLEAA